MLPRFLALYALACLFLFPSTGFTKEPESLEATPLFKNCKTVLFLGDSITFSGQYVNYFEAGLRLAFPETLNLQILNLGLSSETVSGLSEEGHAGGKFPRPDLHERLQRVLTKTKPDLVFACYGMNDGIYLPLENSRFDAFKKGMETLHKKTIAAGARIVHITPPSFDLGPTAKPEAFNYNQTLDTYSTWLLDQKSQYCNVIDLHFPMNREIETRRRKDPSFLFSKDRIHPDSEGHWFMAKEILRAMSLPIPSYADLKAKPELLNGIEKRATLLKLSWLSETGHLRPGVPSGMPLPEAKEEAKKLDLLIQSLLSNPPR
jgi:lysophospholipase L1-like esterase